MDEMGKIKAEYDNHEMKKIENVGISRRNFNEEDGINCLDKSNICYPHQDNEDKVEVKVDFAEQFIDEIGISNREEYIVKSEYTPVEGLSQQIDDVDYCTNKLAFGETVEEYGVFPANKKQDGSHLSDFKVNHQADHSDLKQQCHLVKLLTFQNVSTLHEVSTFTGTVVSVDYLKTIKFSSLSLGEKMEIKSAGRPKPNLSITNVAKCRSREYKRTFKMETYEKIDWLCGCDVSNSLYCFPCLLFESDEASEWTKSGVKDLAHIAEKIKKHQQSKSHLSAKLEFNLLGKQDVRQQFNSAYRLSIEKHNDQVKNNRYVLSKVINCLKFCGAFELDPRGRDENEGSNPGIFKGLVNFSAESDLALRDHLQQANALKGTSADIQNDLLECMLSVCQTHIKKEIASSNFVSVMIEESSDTSNQMVLVLRYTLANGSPVERFWTIVKPNGQEADCIEETLNYVLKNSDQLISQSYSGASDGVQKLIKDKFKHAHYIHCYAHQLNSMMSQATSVNMNVRIFFCELNEVINFFSNSPQRVAVLDEVVGNEVLRASVTGWNFKIKAVNTVYENREAIVECMERIQATFRQTGTITKAGALMRLLRDPKFIFWLAVFHRIMPHVNILYSQLQKGTTDSATVKRYITAFETRIQKEKNNIHIIRGSELVDVDENKTRKRRKTEGITHVSPTAQAEEVCDSILSEVKRRFSFTGHLEMAHLLSVENFETHLSDFPIIHLDSAVRNFPFLNKNKLRTELEIIYRKADFRKVSGAVDLLKFLMENDLEADFSETYSALQAVVTMPMITGEAERRFSTLKRVKTFLRSAVDESGLTALAMLSIEKTMIREITNFNELVIEEFISRK